ncbi:MAG: TonB family protein [Chlorobium sp.]
MKKGPVYSSEKRFYPWVAVATVLHLALFALSLFLQLLETRTQSNPGIVRITLVSLPVPENVPVSPTPSGASAVQAVEKRDQHAESMKSMPKKTVPPKIIVQEKKLPEPKNADQFVKKTVTPSLAKERPLKPSEPVKIVTEKLPSPKSTEREQLSSALERIRQVVGKKGEPQQATSGSPVTKAIAELEQKMKSQGSSAITGSTAERGAVSGGLSGKGKEIGGWDVSLAYKAKIASIIQQNWELANPMLKISSGMKVAVRINILSDGSINQIQFVKKSMSEYLNNSVKKALERSSPLPPLPKEESFRGVWVAFVFTPEGIEK